MFDKFCRKIEQHSQQAVPAAGDGSGNIVQLSDMAAAPGRVPSNIPCRALDFGGNDDIYKNSMHKTDCKNAITEEVAQNLARVGVSPETAIKVLDEISVYGESPREVIKTLMQENRVLAVGEAHQYPNPQRDLVAQNMAALKAAGATHLAVEMPSSLQPVLDDFYETGNVDLQKLPNLIQDDSYLSLMKAARENGTKMVAVDRSDVSDVVGQKTQSHPGEPLQTRDQIMADNIGKVLDQNPDNKVVFFVGAMHLNRSNIPGTKLAADYIRENYDIATIKPVYSTSRGTGLYPLSEITASIQEPVAVSTKSASVLGGLAYSTFNDHDQQYIKDWDYVFIYP